MRTFHTGGVAGDDITQGLPRVEELLKRESQKGLAIITEIDGIVSMKKIKQREKLLLQIMKRQKLKLIKFLMELELRFLKVMLCSWR